MPISFIAIDLIHSVPKNKAFSFCCDCLSGFEVPKAKASKLRLPFYVTGAQDTESLLAQYCGCRWGFSIVFKDTTVGQ